MKVSSDPYDAASSHTSVAMAKQSNISPLAGDQAYFNDERIQQNPTESAVAPPLWARATSLVVISVALAFSIATMGLEANMYVQEQNWYKNRVPSDSDNLHFLVFLFIGFALADCAASIVTLIICLVLTAAKPRLTLVSPATRSMDCLCATICILACASGVSIGLYATLRSATMDYPTPLAVPILRTIFLFAYFAVLLAAKCVRSH